MGSARPKSAAKQTKFAKTKIPSPSKKPVDLIGQRINHELQRQVSLNNRVDKVAKSAAQQAEHAGCDEREMRTHVEDAINQYMADELIRKSQKDVMKRAEEQKKLRKMQGKAYNKVTSKVAANLKVIEKVKKNGGKPAVKPAPGYDPTFFVDESLSKKRTKTPGIKVPPRMKISKDIDIRGDGRWNDLQQQFARDRAALATLSHLKPSLSPRQTQSQSPPPPPSYTYSPEPKGQVPDFTSAQQSRTVGGVNGISPSTQASSIRKGHDLLDNVQSKPIPVFNTGETTVGGGKQMTIGSRLAAAAATAAAAETAPPLGQPELKEDPCDRAYWNTFEAESSGRVKLTRSGLAVHFART